MSVRKRKWITSRGEAREAFIVDYVDQQGERHIRTFDRKGDATAYEATVKVDVRQGVHTASKLTVAEAAEAWIKRVEADGAERTTSGNIDSTSICISCRRSAGQSSRNSRWQESNGSVIISLRTSPARWRGRFSPASNRC